MLTKDNCGEHYWLFSLERAVEYSVYSGIFMVVRSRAGLGNRLRTARAGVCRATALAPTGSKSLRGVRSGADDGNRIVPRGRIGRHLEIDLIQARIAGRQSRVRNIGGPESATSTSILLMTMLPMPGVAAPSEYGGYTLPRPTRYTAIVSPGNAGLAGVIRE